MLHSIYYRNTIITILFIICLIYSCHSTQTGEGINISVFNNIKPSYKTSSFISQVTYTQLETRENCVIGNVTKLIETDDRFYILDSRSAKRIFAFDKSGKYLFTIGNNGKGPREYLIPSDFCVDMINNYILIIDAEKKILMFDLNGNFIKERYNLKQVRSLTSISAHNGQIYGYTGRRISDEKKYQIVQLDSALKPIKWVLPYKYHFLGIIPFNNTLYTFNGRINYVGFFENILYQLDDGKYTKRYLFDFEGKNIPEREITTIEQFTQNKEYSYLFQDFVEGNNIIYSPIFFHGRPMYGFLLKKSNKFLLIESILEDSAIFIPPISYYKDYFISTIRSDLFLKKIRNDSLSINITDNPIIVKYKMKFLNEE